MLGKLNQKQIEFVLSSQTVGRLGCYADGQVYIVPITYVYEEPYIFGYTKEGLKISMMRKNKHVCFEVDVIQNMMNWQSVVVQGEYEELSGEDSQYALFLLKNRMTPLLLSETSLPGLNTHNSLTTFQQVPVAYRIRITDKTGRYEKR